MPCTFIGHELVGYVNNDNVFRDQGALGSLIKFV